MGMPLSSWGGRSAHAPKTMQRNRAYSDLDGVIDADGFLGNVVFVGYGHRSVVLVG